MIVICLALRLALPPQLRPHKAPYWVCWKFKNWWDLLGLWTSSLKERLTTDSSGKLKTEWVHGANGVQKVNQARTALRTQRVRKADKVVGPGELIKFVWLLPCTERAPSLRSELLSSKEKTTLSFAIGTKVPAPPLAAHLLREAIAVTC